MANALNKQQEIYAEIEKSPVEESVRKYFKSKPYHLRKAKTVAPAQQKGIYHERKTIQGIYL